MKFTRMILAYGGAIAALATVYFFLHFWVLFADDYFPARYEDAFGFLFLMLIFWAFYGGIAFLFIFITEYRERFNQK